MNLQRMTLQAGPLSLDFCQGELRYVRLGEREVLRRVYVAVRDVHWTTIPFQISNLELKIEDESFALDFDATHCKGELHFVWHGTILGAADGTITFTMDGTAHSTFQRNRIGLCVLHPIDYAGQPCRVEHPDGTREAGVFPRFIAPHQPFQNIRAITHEAAPGISAEVRLTGDVFEMEDQRNWTDGSFKTYSTPLALPFPVTVQRGERLTQTFTLTLHEQPVIPTAESSTVRLALADAGALSLPQIGLGMASHGQPLTQREINRLQLLNLSHLRVDLPLQSPLWRDALTLAIRDAQALKARLEIALFLSDEAEHELTVFRHALTGVNVPAARWLIFHQAEKVTSEKWITLAREALGNTAPIGAGTNQYFTELNRQRPSSPLGDAICYSFNPQVHATDDDTLRESLAAQAATVISARHVLGAVPLIVTPITLKPRFNPHAPQQTTAPGELPAAVDARQSSLFAAAWTLGSLKYLAESGVASVTYYETTGWRGVMETEQGSPLPALFPSLPGNVFPLWHVFAEIGEWRNAEVLPTTSSAPLRVVSLALRESGRQRWWLANVSEQRQPVCLNGIETKVQARRLNAENVADAIATPESFRWRPPVWLTPTGSELQMLLEPYEIVTLDCV
jgi:D-apionolactonase